MPREPGAGARGWSWGVALVVLAVVGLDVAMVAWVVPAVRVAGWPAPWTLGLIAGIDALVYKLVNDIRSLPDLPEGGRLLPLLSIWRRGCWVLLLLVTSSILVRTPAAFDPR